MCNNNFFCFESYPTNNRRCSCCCFDLRRGCSQQLMCTNRRPVVHRYICRICIPRVNRMPALQNRNTCFECSACGQKAGTTPIQSQKPEVLDKCEHNQSSSYNQGPIQRNPTGGCRCSECCIVFCGR
ncbi:Uncharacterized protein CTYZ_00003702 [Cryptosporidium tyzzeri]|nr:Uncharacterized protein CTYZ_00003702 [Cryptosporidium tyzzeri]